MILNISIKHSRSKRNLSPDRIGTQVSIIHVARHYKSTRPSQNSTDSDAHVLAATGR